MTNQERDAAGIVLGKREREVLKIMRAGTYLDRATPGGWYLGLERVGGAVGFSLMRKMLITIEMEDDTIQVYRINENGIKALEAVLEEADG